MFNDLNKLKKKFNNRDELIEYIKEISPKYKHEKHKGTIEGGLKNLNVILEKIDCTEYAKTRNYIDGKVTKISPYISRGMINEEELIKQIRVKTEHFYLCEKLIQQICWRLFWNQVLSHNPEYAWKNIEEYKTGWKNIEYSDYLPNDIIQANTGSEFINQIIKDLYNDGYIHNHLRLYLSSYIIHWRKVKWQVGAKWFLEHLIDFDLASNNLSWQWVASTFSNKPYIFNLDNIKKYCSKKYKIIEQNNKELDYSYEYLNKILFPNKIQDNL